MAFKPGQSGNPGGRPKGKVKHIAEKAREYAETAIEQLALILEDPEAANKDRIAAAKELLDRGVGKSLAISAKVTGPLEDMNEDELLELIKHIRELKAGHAAGPGGASAPGETKH